VVADPRRSGGLKCVSFNARRVTGKAVELRAWIRTMMLLPLQILG